MSSHQGAPIASSKYINSMQAQWVIGQVTIIFAYYVAILLYWLLLGYDSCRVMYLYFSLTYFVPAVMLKVIRWIYFISSTFETYLYFLFK